MLVMLLPMMAYADDLEIEVEAEAPPPAQVPVPVAPPTAADEALKAQIAALEARLSALETQKAAVVPIEPPKETVEVRGVEISGYGQVQLISNQYSANEVDVEGDPLNQNRFLLRRGRIRFERDFSHAKTVAELDANINNGPAVSVKRFEISGFIPSKNIDSLPPIQLTAGLSEIPFGFELSQSSRSRVFMERTQGSRAFFPGEYDVGAQLTGALGPIRYAFAMQNGVPINNFSNSVYTEEKTWIGRVGFDFATADKFGVSGGVSYLNGFGFHAGIPATKSQLLWSDANQDGIVTLSELEAVNGQAATASETFARWGVNGDLEIAFKTGLGWSHVFAEVTMATNLDRDYFVADPVSTGHDLRESAWSVGATQEVSRWALLGFRVDNYDPNADFFESRRGDFIPTDVSVLTLSPVAGAQLPGFGKLLLQYDYIVDFLGRGSLGQPIDLPNDQWTLRLQGEF